MEITATQACEELLACFKRFKAIMAQLAEAHELTPMQLFALHAIEHGATTMGKIATTLQCDASNVTGIVDRLVSQRLVVRQASAADRRAKILELTDAGRKIITDFYDQMPTLLGCDKLASPERTALHDIIAKLA